MKRPRKLAVVTGASGGLGLEFARLLARDGYDLALVARSQEKLESVARELRERHGASVQTVVLDLAQADAAGELVRRVPRCDVLVNNAGFASNGRFDRLDESRIEEEVRLDVLTLTMLARKYLPAMIERRDGRMLNVASTAAFLPGPFMAVYYAAKAYVLSFSQALAEELRGSGVTVTALCPGPVATDFQRRAGVSFPRGLPVASAEEVVREGYDGMMRGERLVIPGGANRLGAFMTRFAPKSIVLRQVRRMQEKR